MRPQAKADTPPMHQVYRLQQSCGQLNTHTAQTYSLNTQSDTFEKVKTLRPQVVVPDWISSNLNCFLKT